MFRKKKKKWIDLTKAWFAIELPAVEPSSKEEE